MMHKMFKKDNELSELSEAISRALRATDHVTEGNNIT